ncbi:hypothetical protein BDV93DRAFT_552906 [Ceratobasidium sp. AG-I]|nr:hypothetical protein BDV93DRAFT_552906 [Ceratobasidium sp. AG-I]
MARFVDIEAQKLSEPGLSIHWGRALADPDASDKGLEGGWMVTTDHFRPPLESLDPDYFSSPLNKLSSSHEMKNGLRPSRAIDPFRSPWTRLSPPRLKQINTKDVLARQTAGPLARSHSAARILQRFPPLFVGCFSPLGLGTGSRLCSRGDNPEVYVDAYPMRLRLLQPWVRRGHASQRPSHRFAIAVVGLDVLLVWQSSSTARPTTRPLYTRSSPAGMPLRCTEWAVRVWTCRSGGLEWY